MKLNSILKSFRKTVKKLDELVQENSKEITSNFEQIFELEDKNENLQAEVDKADKVAKQIRGLIGEGDA